MRLFEIQPDIYVNVDAIVDVQIKERSEGWTAYLHTQGNKSYRYGNMHTTKAEIVAEIESVFHIHTLAELQTP